MSFRLAGAVVLYNPDNKVINNINSYIKDLEELFVVDNSETVNSSVVKTLKSNPKVRYHWNHDNKGIAYALNYAARGAINRGYEWLLLLDQDSVADMQMVPKIVNFILNSNTENIGIVSAYQKVDTEKQKKSFREFEACDLVITSGSTINLKAYQKVGGFEQKLFIDMVDHEYCLRLRRYRYKIIKINNALLLHQVGKTRLVNGHLVSLHTYNRLYYFVRNMLFVRKCYLNEYPELVEGLSKEVTRRCRDNLIYGDKKFRQLKCIVRGFIDFNLGRWGRR